MNSTQRRLSGVGIQYEANRGALQDLPDYDPVTSEHLWTIITTYRVADPDAWMTDTDVQSLDQENLIAVTPIICLHCEQAWTADLAAAPCDGDPT